MADSKRLKEAVLAVFECRHLTPIPEEKDDFLEKKEMVSVFNFETEKYIVIFVDKVTKDTVSLINGYEKSNNVTFLIVASVITATGRSGLIGALCNSKINIDFWYSHQLLVNPLTHSMTPLHHILNEEEKKREIPRHNDVEFLRTMEGFRDDIVIKWLGGKVGDIVRIERYSDIMKGRITSYRIVRKILNF